MGSITAALDALDIAVELLGAADIEQLPAPERFFSALERLETAVRRQVAVSHTQLTHLERYEGCPPIPIVLADVLRISRSTAKRRVRDAEQLVPRRSLTGEPLAPLLPMTGKAWDAGLLDGEHVRVIQKFFRDLPDHVGTVEIEKAERTLAEHAQTMRPDQLEKIADRLAVHLNPPDGQYSEEDRARKRGFMWCGGQRADGMSVGKLVADPALRSMLDAWLAKFAAPEPDDPRSHAQRQHDALADLVRGRLGDPKLGQHNGLPVTMIVTTTLQELQAGAGHAVTAGGTLLPITDLLRMATPGQSLPSCIRRRYRAITVAGPQQAIGLRGSTNHAAGQIPWLHGTGMHRQRLQQPGPPRRQRLETRRQHRHRRPHTRVQM